MKKTLVAAAVIAASQSVSADGADGLELVSVTASRVEIPREQLGVSVSVLTRPEIQRLGYTSLMDVLRTLPGVSISNSGGAGKVSSLFIRGESNYRTLVLLDGVNIADPTSPQVSTQLQHLLAADVERIEVLRGPQGMMYGAGAGGVINIVTRKAQSDLEGRLALEAGRYGTTTGSAGVGGRRGAFDYALNVSTLDTEGFNSRAMDLSGERDGYRNRTADARLGYRFSDTLDLSLQLRHNDNETDFDGCFFSPSSDCVDQFTQQSYRLGLGYSGAGKHQLDLAEQRIERDNLDDGISTFAVEGTIRELNYVGNTAAAGGELVWGAEYEQQEFASAFSDQEIDSLGLFSEWRGDMAGKLFYTLGVRHENLETDDRVSWRSSLAYPVLLGPNQQLKLRASYGTGYRAPSPFEVSYNLGEGVAPVGPETSRGYEVGAEYRLGSALEAELVLFDQQISDAIVFDFRLGSSGFGAYRQDPGESRSRGIELSLGGAFGEHLDWYFNGTLLDSEDAGGNQRLGVAQQVANLGGSYRWLGDAVVMGVNWQYVGDRKNLNPRAFGIVGLDPYNKLDLKLSYQLSSRVALSLRGENLLNEDYREVAGFNTAGAAVYGGVQLRL
ncbi:TonB-dependent receptor plug domain-containing protein [Microbulbifer sp. TYP-18]|uniref:TonB-dependent receptor plug domain-containing protein n=1 Tax=Microbulbifer sp. TYP-18 TaxID=3230024 RepID=UPI0034C66A9F